MEVMNPGVDFFVDADKESILRLAGIFDSDWYRAKYADGSPRNVDLFGQFLRYDWLTGRRPNAHFDPLWYLEINDDVKTARIHPLVHYWFYGENEGRQPCPHFDPLWYRTTYAIPTGESCLAHYLKHPENYGIPPPRYRHFPNCTIRKITVTRLDGLGDIILSLGFLGGLHARFPSSELEVVVRPHLADIRLLLPPWVTISTLPFDQYTIPQEPSYILEIKEALKTFAARSEPDLVVLGEYNKIWVSEVLASLWQDAAILAFDSPSALNHNHDLLLQGLRIETPLSPSERVRRVAVSPFEHEGTKYEHLLESIGHVGDHLPTLSIPRPALERAKKVYKALRLSPRRTVVIFPSTAEGLKKSLTRETWTALADLIVTETKLDVLFVGGPSDLEAMTELRNYFSARFPVHVAHDESLVQITALISLAHLYIGADTGPLHIAATLGKKAIGFFGGGHDAHRFLPVGTCAFAFRMQLTCYGCNWDCPFESRLCLTHMSLDCIRSPLLEIIRAPVQSSPTARTVSEVVDLPTETLFVRSLPYGVQNVHRQFIQENHRTLSYIEALRRKLELLEAAQSDVCSSLERISIRTAVPDLEVEPSQDLFTPGGRHLRRTSQLSILTELHRVICDHYVADRNCTLRAYDTTALITSFRRYEKLERTVASLRENGISSIVIAAAGVDETGAIELMRLVRRFPTVRLAATETDLGCNKSWLSGLYMVDTKYVMILHDDDMLAPEFSVAFREEIGPALAWISQTRPSQGGESCGCRVF